VREIGTRRVLTEKCVLAIKFVVEHERLLALVLFILSYMKIFGTILSIIFFIPRHISLLVLWCLGFRKDGIECGAFC